MDPRLARHIDACNNAPDGGRAGRVALRIGGEEAGRLPPELARALAGASAHLRLDANALTLDPALDTVDSRSAALEEAVAAMVSQGRLRHRREPFDVRARGDGPVLARLDRGAVAAFGVPSQGAHLNGLVRRPDGLHLWVGWRSPHKAIAPGQMDNIVAGGVPAGLSPRDTLLKEAGEEASMPEALAATARETGLVRYVMHNEEGLRRDALTVFDVELPEEFVPRPNDDEVERFELWPAARVLEAVCDTDLVKFNVNLVLIDLFLREGLVEDPDGQLRAGLDRPG